VAAFAAVVRSDIRFRLAVDPENNIVCFRFAPEGYNDLALNQINSEIRRRIIKEGSFYIVQVELNGKAWLRLTIINPVISLDDLIALVTKINEIGSKKT
jgi:L-2,4-diaminobutyrate decarboxylase